MSTKKPAPKSVYEVSMEAQTTDGTNVGVWSSVRGPGSMGVRACTTGEKSTGVWAYADGENGNGVSASADGENGTGVSAYADGKNGRGVWAYADGKNGTGVWASADGENGTGVVVAAEQGVGVLIRNGVKRPAIWAFGGPSIFSGVRPDDGDMAEGQYAFYLQPDGFYVRLHTADGGVRSYRLVIEAAVHEPSATAHQTPEEEAS